jgi:hypothetical protein
MSEAQKKVEFLEHRARFGKDGSRRSEDACVYSVDGQLVTVLVAFLAVTTLDGRS